MNRDSEIIYRPALPADIPEMVDLHLLSVTDLLKRNGISRPPTPREALFPAYEHICSTGVFRVAERNNRIVAIAAAIIRDQNWFLSAFWVLPDHQQKKIGLPLLKQVYQAGVDANATTFFTWASIDTTAMACYMKLGMLPGYQILWFEGTPHSLPSIPASYESNPLNKTIAMELDATLRGTPRKVDHEFWSDHLKIPGRQIMHNGKPIGYYYINKGSIGPAAWNHPQHAEAVLNIAFRDAAEMSPTIRVALPGINHAAIRHSLGSGFRLVIYSHLLTTAPFGRMEQYIPSGPLFF
ncbi:MAG TPA: GNAT family N-acetyltransferase [Tepidisphaeraceae bacterium]|jgi:hypothetical protein